MDGVSVSVIIPCFNLGSYLDEAVESVLAQTFQDFEILVVDDGSTDEETRRVLAEYRKPRTRVLRSENRGLPAAKNLGLAHTTGPYVCMLDADDRLEPALLEKSVAALDHDPSVAFVSHWLRTFGDETWEWKPTRCEAPFLLDVNTVNGAALVRRTALEAVGGFDESMRDGCEDWDFWISLVERGFKGRILPEILFQYRRRPESMSRTMMRGEGHPGLYRRLAAKHARIYGDHISALVVRREEDLSNLRRHNHDMELEHYRWLGPELAKWRDDVEMLERKAERIARRRADEAERARLQDAIEESARHLAAEQARLGAAIDEMRTALDEVRAAGETMRAALDEERTAGEESRAALDQERARADAALASARVNEAQSRAEHERLRAEHERLRAEQERLRAEHERLHADRERLRAERDSQERAFAAARDCAFELDASFNRVRAEIEDLKGSFSWRLMAPLRALYGAMRRAIGRNGS